MKNKKIKRRDFIRQTSFAGMGLAMGLPHLTYAGNIQAKKAAILGGPKAFTGNWSRWPIIGQTERDELIQVLNSGGWCRLGNKTTPRFETEYQNLVGAKRTLGVSSGTTALLTMLGALEVGPGDEVIIPPYTFIATYNVIVQNYALPVFADVDIESFQVDAKKIESAITKNTKVLMPVHIAGSPFDVDKVLEVSKNYNIPLIEDACQAHLAEWKGKCVGNWGLGGAFSFQESKNLSSGEGGAIITNNDAFYQDCYSFHHQGQGADAASLVPGSGSRGSNFRLTEFQAAILLAQMTRLSEQVKRRWENAQYLTKMLKEIPGIAPAKLYAGTTKSAYHLYMFRYDKKRFSGMSRAQFINALNAEGVPCSVGYTSMPKEKYVTNLAHNKHYLSIYGEKRMKEWLESLSCPQNDKLCNEEAVWFAQTMLLGTKTDMEQIAEGIRKIARQSREISKI
ncbi:DegT/DnrJ/EryC1/StrS family aminotransferase [Proteiniphilum propionicum]|jgi:dTDP-4-amino-4,6-dideoxygalactose transaminase|uniref:DegT/DnrJ/EryC1/StrS family aminotransferase n=1 Tax=Proteiniphilum propionicum TaxID=2829812 RepID=UPI001EECC342|nr:DegT/DnrJ/EryC1/StrS family aminotransferase [Proteiniphilum propionicum]